MKKEKTEVFLFILLVGIIGVFYHNTINWLIDSWINNQYYSHGFIVPIVSIYIVWNMRKELSNIYRKQSQTGLVLLISGVVLYGVSYMSTIRFLSGLSLVITIFGVILYLHGWEFANKIKFPILFLLMAVPVPFVDLVASPAQTISAVSSSSMANLLGVSVQREGFILNMSTGKFEVALECSGINSIISLLTISIIFAFVLEGSLLMKSVIVLSSVLLAMMGNILRITSTLIVASKYGHEAALNYFHDFSSFLLFSVALIGLFLVGRSFGRLKFKNIF